MTSPSDYNNAKVTVDPNQLWTLATSVDTEGKKMAAAVAKIFSALEKLKTGWDSDSAAAAQSFYQQLMAACDDLFGSDGSDGSGGGRGSEGAIPAYVGFLKSAADAFDAGEKDLEKQWRKFNAGFDSPDSGGGGKPPSGADTAITWSAASR